MAMGTSHVMKCGRLTPWEGRAVPNAVAHPRINPVLLKPITVRQWAIRASRERMPWGELPVCLPREIRKLEAYATMRQHPLQRKASH